MNDTVSNSREWLLPELRAQEGDQMIECALVPELDAIAPRLLAQDLPLPILGDEARRGMEPFNLSAHVQLERIATLGEE